MNFLQKKKGSIYGTKEACRPLWNQTRWGYCAPPKSLSPGNSGTNTNKCGNSLDTKKNQKINITENRQWAGECVTKNEQEDMFPASVYSREQEGGQTSHSATFCCKSAAA